MLRPHASHGSILNRAHLGRTPLLTPLAALLLTAAMANAQTWNETGPDAGQTLPGNATSGSGPLTRINGAIANAGQDADIYQIRITNPAAFTATTVGQTTIDTQLFLFDSTGRGITFNDDATSSVRQSTITGQFVPAAGVYYLAITPFDYDPQSPGGDIWQDLPYAVERAPDGTGAASAFTAWSGANTNTGAYGIDLIGASFFTNTSGSCPPNFAPAANYAVGNGSDVALADLNRDGRIDLVVADAADGAGVSVRLGNGDGTFGTASTYLADSSSSSNGALSLVVVDLNRDGKLDVACLSSGNRFGVLMGNGDGTLGTATTYTAGTQPHQIVTADFNNDGTPDIATALVGGDQTSLRLGVGDGTFLASSNAAVGTDPFYLAAGDVNSDGKPDLIVGNHFSDNISVLLGNGNGSFQAAVNYATPTFPEHIVLGDFNGDGARDIAVSCSHSSNPCVSVRLGNGNGVFQAAVNFPAGNATTGLCAGDLNGDGRLDLVTSNFYGSDASVLLGNGDGTFQSPKNFATAYGASNVAIGDVNGDGRPDFVVANQGESVSVLLQQPGTSGPTITTQPTPQAIPVGSLATFTVAATGSVTYQWRRNGINLSDVGEIAGSATATLQILPSLQGYDNSAFDCVVTNACGSTTSSPASLSLIPLCPADVDDGSNTGTHDNGVDINDLLYFLFHFEAGC